MKRGFTKVKIFLLAIIIFIIIIAVYFKLPYSRLRNEFNDYLKESNSTMLLGLVN